MSACFAQLLFVEVITVMRFKGQFPNTANCFPMKITGTENYRVPADFLRTICGENPIVTKEFSCNL